MPKPWNENEQAAIVAAYNAMLAIEATGYKYNKAAINRYLRGEDAKTDRGREPDRLAVNAVFDLRTMAEHKAGVPAPVQPARGSLAARSRGSLELKLMNISAARADLKLPTVKGYKAAGNYQKSLRAEILRQWPALRFTWQVAEQLSPSEYRIQAIPETLPHEWAEDLIERDPSDKVAQPRFVMLLETCGSPQALATFSNYEDAQQWAED